MAVACTGSSPTPPPPTFTRVTPSTPTGGKLPDHATQLELARQKITRIIFLVKENRTFDTMFGLYPGADGATTGKTCD